jgi:hypothetical protein
MGCLKLIIEKSEKIENIVWTYQLLQSTGILASALCQILLCSHGHSSNL